MLHFAGCPSQDSGRDQQVRAKRQRARLPVDLALGEVLTGSIFGIRQDRTPALQQQKRIVSCGRLMTRHEPPSRKTLHALFAHPLSANVDFKKVIHLLEDLEQRLTISLAIESV